MARRVFLIGDTTHPEFSRLSSWLERHTDVTRCGHVDQAVRQIAAGQLADTVLIVSAYRDQFTQAEVEQLQRASPLSVFYAVIGSWCEGETRSGLAWPGIDRLYVNQVIPRARAEGWQVPDRVIVPSPTTASPDERWLARAGLPWPTASGLVVICSRYAASRAALSELCRAAGFQTVAISGPDHAEANPVAVIYDADRNRERRRQDLMQLRDSFPAARIILLIEYPRHDEIAQAASAGADGVLGKPFDVIDLLDLLNPNGRDDPNREQPAN